eukprot:15472990-Alexandrium_andersonii.AAC.1
MRAGECNESDALLQCACQHCPRSRNSARQGDAAVCTSQLLRRPNTDAGSVATVVGDIECAHTPGRGLRASPEQSRAVARSSSSSR